MRNVRIAYLVHDLDDAAVARRAGALRGAGADVVVAGFRRRAEAPAAVAGAAAIDLGRTADARLGQRALAVAANLARPGRLRAAVAGADVILARNLEALALAVRARRWAPGARIVYECLDIHRMLLGRRLRDRAIQRVEARLLRHVDLILVSSPAFRDRYFGVKPDLCAPVLVVENRVPAEAAGAVVTPPGPPWTIGWFGMLRCRRSFGVLTALAAQMGGRVEVLIAGRPSAAEFDDFAGAVAAAAHCRYVGPYRPGELSALYGRCHFAWAIDWFEAGLNSDWLLPNRLYEAAAHGVVPVALAPVETGRWLARRGAGVLIDAAEAEAELERLFDALDAAGYARLRAEVAAIPRGDVVADAEDARTLLAAIAGA